MQISRCLLGFTLLVAPVAEAAGLDEDPETEFERGEVCAVTGPGGARRDRAEVAGEASMVRHGLLGSRARVVRGVIRLRRGLVTAQIGNIEGEELVAPDRVTLERYTSSGTCSARQIALGVAHLEALRADHHD